MLVRYMKEYGKVTTSVLVLATVAVVLIGLFVSAVPIIQKRLLQLTVKSQTAQYTLGLMMSIYMPLLKSRRTQIFLFLQKVK